MDKNIIRNILAGKGITNDHQSNEADYQAIWTELFIPWSKSGLISKSKLLIEDSISDFEKTYLEDCKAFLDDQKKILTSTN